MKTATALLHAGHRADPATNAVAVPIHMTTSYQFDSLPRSPSPPARRRR